MALRCFSVDALYRFSQDLPIRLLWTSPADLLLRTLRSSTAAAGAGYLRIYSVGSARHRWSLAQAVDRNCFWHDHNSSRLNCDYVIRRNRDYHGDGPLGRQLGLVAAVLEFGCDRTFSSRPV